MNSEIFGNTCNRFKEGGQEFLGIQRQNSQFNTDEQQELFKQPVKEIRAYLQDKLSKQQPPLLEDDNRNSNKPYIEEPLIPRLNKSEFKNLLENSTVVSKSSLPEPGDLGESIDVQFTLGIQ